MVPRRWIRTAGQALLGRHGAGEDPRPAPPWSAIGPRARRARGAGTGGGARGDRRGRGRAAAGLARIRALLLPGQLSVRGRAARGALALAAGLAVIVEPALALRVTAVV